MSILPDLFCTFFRVGILTFGGGYAMLPMLEREIVNKKQWASEEDLLDYFAVGQCTPGIIAVNTATFVGYRQKKTAGAVLATLGVIAPSILIITIIAAVLSNFADYPVVQNAFAGIRVCVCVLIINSVIKLVKKAVVDKLTLAIYILVFAAAVLFTAVSPVMFILASAVLGIIVRVWLHKGEGAAR